MKIRTRLNITFTVVVAAVLIIMGLAFRATHNILTELGGDYKWLAGRLDISIYALLVVSTLAVISGIIISRGLMSRIFRLIEKLNTFTVNMAVGHDNSRLDVKNGSDELEVLASNLNRLSDSYKEKIVSLEDAIVKRQRAVRELAILNELMGFVTTEFKFDIILKNFVERTKDLIKSGFGAAIIFAPDSYTPSVYVTSDDIQDPSTISIDPEGFFKAPIKDMSPLRLPADRPENEDISQEPVKVSELNIEVNNILAVPLISSINLSGMLFLANRAGDNYKQEDEDILMDFAFQAFQTIAMHEEITNLAVTDGLTGINNHRHFQERLAEEVEISKRYGRNLSLLILDVDHFKNFNDIYGHQVGDSVLKTIASVLSQQIRKTDFPARYGGEEFVAVMPETDFQGAGILAERLRARIAKTPFVLPDNEKVNITVSIGFASMPENASEKTELIEMADKALYFAKEHGRNVAYGFEAGRIPGTEEKPFDASPAAMENLASIVDARSPYTKGHSEEVSKLAAMIANAIGLDEGELESLKLASVLHDIGTIHVPERILNKPGELTEEEVKVIRAHPKLAEMVLKKYPLVEEVLPIILYHHERYDGKGYPAGIAGEEIPLHARILAIAEAFNAMISPRPYKKRLTVDEAVKELEANAGSQFDPQLVKVFTKVVAEIKI
ncbi:MAG TPA: diguanylate cyclase [Nitrospirae bacterium]|nr:cyclic di-GMP phosphodiesterase response regulator RpfG [bacterium BMS3Abin10]GBE38804.1 cyclic di-GMP phosphodiesterase response regulator RpfG [bacterium BMS3Bbin08]HDH50378.1 diguanylate cyclase [Nitrospirota bacterium]HDK81733.1 diguanylate cyclase [Nitrospirota bacterium]